MRTLLAAFGKVGATGAPCEHPADQLTPVTGNVCHCTCGEAFKVPCQHIRVQRLLPRVFQCVDCGETRGAGE